MSNLISKKKKISMKLVSYRIKLWCYIYPTYAGKKSFLKYSNILQTKP